MCVCVCVRARAAAIRGTTFFLFGHVVRVTLAVGVVALLFLPRRLAAVAALRLLYLLTQVPRWGHTLHRHLQLLEADSRQRDRERDREGEREREIERQRERETRRDRERGTVRERDREREREREGASVREGWG